jgi:peptide/nickel transport system substrate-binding protein
MANTVPSYQKAFNPYSASRNLGTQGLVYEPLILRSPSSQKGVPWLATDQQWAQDGKSVVFTIRDGVKWSDGKPFTAADVAFSFNLLTKYPELNIGALPVQSATASGDKATVTFSAVAFSYEPSVDNFTPVPEHVWASQNAAKWTNPDPVGTGPYTVGKFSPQLITYAKNKNYWQPDKIKVDTIEYPAATPQTFVSNLGAGKYDWAGGFVANIQKLYVDKDPKHNKYWFPGDGLVDLAMNLQKAPFDDVKLRSAISLAVDRTELSKTAENGYMPPASPTGLVLPALASYMDPQYADSKFSYNVKKANSMLDDAGYKKAADGIRVAPDGKRLSFSLSVPSGYTDWVTMTKLLQSQLKQVGIEIKPQGVSAQSWSASLHSGEFDMTVRGVTMGTGAYSLYRSFLSSALSAPAGQSATSNYARWEDPKTDEYLSAYANTSDKSAQKKAIQGLEGIVVNELPEIPLLQSANWAQYRTANFTGWPSAKNPYALPAPYQFPDNLLVITHLKPVSK